MDSDVNGFVEGDISIGTTGGSSFTTANFTTVDANTYTIDITVNGAGGTVTVNVGANVAQEDPTGIGNLAATQFVINVT